LSGRLFVLAIDHRASFRRWSSDVLGAEADAALLSEMKLIVADALVAATMMARAHGLGTDEVAMLCELEYGAGAIARARQAGLPVVIPVEQSGQQEFAFEHGEDGFAAAIAESGAGAVKALVRYNPSPANEERNARSRTRLGLLGRFCEQRRVPYMLELLVPAGEGDVDATGQPSSQYEASVRPGLTLRAIAELREIGLHPQWWKLEGQPGTAGFEAVAEATGAMTGATSCLVLGRAAAMMQVVEWVEQAAVTTGFAGFAVGRTLWSPALTETLRGDLSRAGAVTEIAECYLSLVDAYRRAEARGRVS